MFSVIYGPSFLLENCRTKMLEGDVLGQLVQLFQSSYSDVRCLSVNAFSALVQFGIYIFNFYIYSIAHRLLEDCRAKIVEGHIVDHLIKLFQDSNWLLQSLSINTAMTLIRFGTYLRFVVYGCSFVIR